ncbi:MAG: hypothetical protein K9G64_07365 [Bacteroidia bacterium]|nr:hypothetical protein [Bacteroidia bacterium]
MIEKLTKLIKENAGDLIINNLAINDEFNDAVISETGNVILNGLKSEVSKGNIAGLTEILRSNGNFSNNQIVNGMILNLNKSLTAKFNLNNDDAEHIATNLIPEVVHQLILKTNDPNDDSFNVQGLLSNLGGKGLGGMLINMFSSNKK